ncbi:MAG: four helix bundle protein [Povalibacter sp.]
MASPAFESLRVWHDARELVRHIYSLTKRGGFASDFSFRDQIRRAALSVMSNIAEGHERGGTREFAYFLSIAKGSSGEVRSQLYAAEDVGYIEPAEAAKLRGMAAEVARKIQALADARGKREASASRKAATAR